jgi:hypothetical protein
MSLHTGLDQIHTPDLPHFSIAGILGRSLVITIWNFMSFVGMALVFAVPVVALTWAIFGYGEVDARIDITNFEITSRADQTLAFLGLVFISEMLFLMVQAAVAYRAFHSFSGYGAGFGACLARSVAVLLHLGELAIVASVVLGAFAVLAIWETVWFVAHGHEILAWVFGALLAGVLLYIVAGCWVVFPAIVVERIGPVAAILRSWRLTRGHRWQILVLLAVFALLEYAISFLLKIEFTVTLAGPVTAMALHVPLSFLGAVVLTASYYNLVGERDGVGALSRVFA